MFDDIFKKFVKNFDGSMDDIVKDFDKYFDEAIRASGWQPSNIQDSQRLNQARKRILKNAKDGKYKTKADKKQWNDWKKEEAEEIIEEKKQNKQDKKEAKERKKEKQEKLRNKEKTKTEADTEPLFENKTIFDKPELDPEEKLKKQYEEALEQWKNGNNPNINNADYNPPRNNFDAGDLNNAGYTINNIDGIDSNGNIIKGETRSVKGSNQTIRNMDDVADVAREGGSVFNLLDELKDMSLLDKIGTVTNIGFAVSDYKDARRQGHGVVSSVARAGTQFVMGELLGIYYPLVLGAKALPGAIVKGSELLYKENRKMNSMANQQVFGGAQFQDTQQLATMRQSGMEMAKMSQYNLQQTLMGQEATHLHR